MKRINEYMGSVLTLLTCLLIILPQIQFQFVDGSGECTTHPTDIVAVVGEKWSMQCNVSNKNSAYISSWRLGPTHRVYRAPIYEYPAHTDNGYLVVATDKQHVFLQSNSTSLTQAGIYHCHCDIIVSNEYYTSSVNVAVIASQPNFTTSDNDKRNLTCSISFNGSTNASFELYIKDFNGTILSNQTNLPFVMQRNVYSVTYRVTTNSLEQEETFICQVYLVNKQSFEVQYMYNASANFTLTRDPPNQPNSTISSPRDNADWSIYLGVAAAACVVAVTVGLIIFICHRLKQRAAVSAMDKEKSGRQTSVDLQQLAVPLLDGQPYPTDNRGLTRNGEKSSSAKTCAHGNSELANGGIRRPPIDRNQISTPVPNKEVHLEENDLYGSTQ